MGGGGGSLGLGQTRACRLAECRARHARPNMCSIISKVALSTRPHQHSDIAQGITARHPETGRTDFNRDSQLNSAGTRLTWIHLDSLGLTWVHLHSLEFTWTHLDSLGPLGLNWTHLDSLGLTWTHSDSLGLTWIYLDPLGLTGIH